jgi:hypothetical protein
LLLQLLGLLEEQLPGGLPLGRDVQLASTGVVVNGRPGIPKKINIEIENFN